MKKKELAMPQKMFNISIIAMFCIFMVALSVFNLGEYIEILAKIWPIVKIVSIILEIILASVLIISIGLSRFNGYQLTINVSLEDAPSEFNNAYEKIYEKYFKYLKKLKGKLGIIEIMVWFSYVLAVFSWAIAYVVIEYVEPQELGIVLFVVALSLMGLPSISLAIRGNKKIKYIRYFKEFCIKEFFDSINVRFFNLPPVDCERHLLYVFNDIRCDSKNAYIVNVDDYIEKDINGKTVKLYETSFNGTFNQEDLLLFNGMFSYKKLDKEFGEGFRIKNNDLYENNDLKKVDFNLSKFSQNFSLYTVDGKLPIDVPINELSEKLVDLYNKYGIGVEINVRYNVLAIKFYTGDMFEPAIIGKPLDKEILYAYYTMVEACMQTFYEMMEILNNR